MPKSDDILHSILVVSSLEQFDEIAGRALARFRLVDYRKSASTARRCLLERYYDLVIINTPLRDETGRALAIDISLECNAGVLLVTPSEMYENVLDEVTDYGILVLSRPMVRGRLENAIRYIAAVQNRVHALEKRILNMEEKLEENRIMNRAKYLLMEQEHLTEDEAHRQIGKQAMNSGISRRAAALRILDEAEEANGTAKKPVGTGEGL